MTPIARLADPSCAAPLFAGWDETMVWSCLQGVMGSVWAVAGETGARCPRSALALLGDFIFYGGRPDARLAAWRPPAHLGNGVLLVPRNNAWARCLEAVWKDRAHPLTRYSFTKDPGSLDPRRLEHMAASLPDGFSVVPIDEGLYRACQGHGWSQDFVANDPCWDDFARLGLGFVALRGEDLAAGASSYASYRSGIEVQVETALPHRRRGLARACAARLMLTCLERGLYPSWDAANEASVALAQQLGYGAARPYRAYQLTA